jgi:uncharacterized protein YuzE
MEKKCRFSYSEIDDSIILSCKEENEVVKENFMFDDLVFSLTGRGKIVGMQIRNFSKMLKESGIDPKIAENIKESVLIIMPKQNNLFMGLVFVTVNAEIIKIPLGRIFMPNI